MEAECPCLFFLPWSTDLGEDKIALIVRPDPRKTQRRLYHTECQQTTTTLREQGQPCCCARQHSALCFISISMAIYPHAACPRKGLSCAIGAVAPERDPDQRRWPTADCPNERSGSRRRNCDLDCFKFQPVRGKSPSAPSLKPSSTEKERKESA